MSFQQAMKTMKKNVFHGILDEDKYDLNAQAVSDAHKEDIEQLWDVIRSFWRGRTDFEAYLKAKQIAAEAGVDVL